MNSDLGLLPTPGAIGAQPTDADLEAIAALTTTTFGRGLLTLANIAALRTLLGTGYTADLAASYAPSLSPWQSGRIYRTPNAAALSTGTPSSGRLQGVRVYVPGPVTLAKLGAEVTGAGAASTVVRLGIYADDGTGRPGALVVDAGTIDGTSATEQAKDISVTLQRGFYWFMAVTQGASTQPTIRVINPNGPAPAELCIDYGSGNTPGAGTAAIGVRQDSVTGALPSTFSYSNLAAQAPAMFVKVA